MGLFQKDPISVQVQGKELRCLVCAHDEFHRREAQLNTATASLLGIDWTNSTGLCYICARCGYIHWFLPT